ncbi:ankyrin repeat domain-containing protein 1-like [Trichogramma pretiosum]|uniref:ankyrin repeat domain-containing protein 1-like n=1 Tax=Trichogramma pretiosum TaxID=7493 RepID=UPI0006C98836|nr:ankyrin repeat domain-containing protein 1-like [Trichogramma pretiosum]
MAYNYVNRLELDELKRWRMDRSISHLHLSCLRGFYDVVEKFLDIYHIDPNACPIPRTGNSPLHLALARGHHRVAELLVRRGANPNTANEERSTPLHMICRSLANYGIDWAEWLMNLRDELHRPLHVNSQDRQGNAPLHSVQRAHMNPLRCLKTSRALLERGADVNLINADGQAPLLLAVCSLMPDVVKLPLGQRRRFINIPLSREGRASMPFGVEIGA